MRPIQVGDVIRTQGSSLTVIGVRWEERECGSLLFVCIEMGRSPLSDADSVSTIWIPLSSAVFLVQHWGLE